MPYLLKTEPDVYSIDDLEREGATVWDGVGNAQAVGYLARMPAGERLVIYHTGKERCAAGLARCVAVNAENPKAPEVRIQFVKKLKSRRTLAELKAQKLFADSLLVKQGRLGVVPLTAAQYEWIAGK